MHRLSNMDPDDIICELAIDTDTLMDRLWEEIEEYIARAYDDEEEDLDDDEEDPFEQL